jgi:hypothetical protein
MKPILGILCLFFSLGILSQKITEKEKIEFLLEQVEKSGIVFIRNGEKHKAKEARAHMERKLNYAGNKIRTADQFIQYLGTKSSMTGKPYYVILPDGTQLESAKWLREQLKKVE